MTEASMGRIAKGMATVALLNAAAALIVAWDVLGPGEAVGYVSRIVMALGYAIPVAYLVFQSTGRGRGRYTMSGREDPWLLMLVASLPVMVMWPELARAGGTGIPVIRGGGGWQGLVFITLLLAMRAYQLRQPVARSG